MTLPVFTPPQSPAPGLQIKPEIKILQAEFGDGYSQPTPDGLNHIRRTLTLTWEGLERSERDQIISFLEARKGTEPFTYTVPGSATAGAYTCAEWSDTALEASLYTVNATFKQNFGNAS